VRTSPHLSGAGRDAEPAEGTVEAVFEGRKIRTLTFAPSAGPTTTSTTTAPPKEDWTA